MAYTAGAPIYIFVPPVPLTMSENLTLTAPRPAPPPRRTAAPRALGLDALRGFAILTMVLSGVVPYGVLPAWMYHAQLPPPTHAFDPALPGLTWVDLVFPLFLFAMGAAFPLALRRREAKGDGTGAVVRGLLARGALLAAFAVVLQHVRPYALDPSPTRAAWAAALLGFGLLFALYARLPAAWPAARRRGVRLAGWGGMAALLALWPYPDGAGFSLQRHDVILIILTNMAVLGGLAWWFTRDRPLARLALCALVLAARLGASAPGPLADLWAWSPAPWLFRFDYLGYLLIVLPATFVGDRLWTWTQAAAAPEGEGRARWALAAVSVLLVGTLLVGLQARALGAAALGAAVLGGAALVLTRHPADERGRLLRDLARWGAFLLALGLLAEPFEGGIKKDPATLSYFFVTAGAACYVLAALAVLVDAAGRRYGLGLLVANGQNPMIAYVGIMNLVLPVLHLTGAAAAVQAVTGAPWAGLARGAAYTLVLAVVVRAFTRRGWFWKT